MRKKVLLTEQAEATGVGLILTGHYASERFAVERLADYLAGQLSGVHVWPSRRETTQTTLLVLAMVILVGLMLWLFDMLLLWAVKLLTGQGG